MTNRIGPVDQGITGKIGSKVDETSTTKTVPGSAAAKDTSNPSSTAQSDTVNLTSSAKLLARLDETLASLPAVNAERVAEIKSAIENGEYQIDSDAIAEAMIRLDRSLAE